MVDEFFVCTMYFVCFQRFNVYLCGKFGVVAESLAYDRQRHVELMHVACPRMSCHVGCEVDVVAQHLRQGFEVFVVCSQCTAVFVVCFCRIGRVDDWEDVD